MYDQLVKKVNAIQAADASNLIKKTDKGTKISETEKKIIDHDHANYITTQEFNKLTADNFAGRLAQILDSNNKVTNWMSTGISFEKIKPFDTNLELSMSNLANGRVILKVTNWMSTGISSEKIKPFDTNLEPTMSHLANSRVTLKGNSSSCIVTLF